MKHFNSYQHRKKHNQKRAETLLKALGKGTFEAENMKDNKITVIEYKLEYYDFDMWLSQTNGGNVWNKYLEVYYYYWDKADSSKKVTIEHEDHIKLFKKNFKQFDIDLSIKGIYNDIPKT